MELPLPISSAASQCPTIFIWVLLFHLLWLLKLILPLKSCLVHLSRLFFLYDLAGAFSALSYATPPFSSSCSSCHSSWKECVLEFIKLLSWLFCCNLSSWCVEGELCGLFLITFLHSCFEVSGRALQLTWVLYYHQLQICNVTEKSHFTVLEVLFYETLMLFYFTFLIQRAPLCKTHLFSYRGEMHAELGVRPMSGDCLVHVRFVHMWNKDFHY